MGDLLTYDVEISLDVGQKILFVGANESGIKRYKEKGDDRVVFMPIGDMDHIQELKIRNFGIALINGRVPEEKLGHAEAVIDRARIPVVLTLEDGGRMTRVAEQYPYKNGGVVTLTVGGVVKEARSQTVQPQKPLPPAPPIPPAPTPQPAPAPQSPTKDTPPPAPRPKLQEVLDKLPEIFTRHNWKQSDTIKHVRNLGITKEMISDAALYGRMSTIRKRMKGKDFVTDAQVVPSHEELLVSLLGGKLKSAMNAAQTANAEVMELLGQVVEQNELLRQSLTELDHQLVKLPNLTAETERLKGRLNPFLRAAGLPEEV